MAVGCALLGALWLAAAPADASLAAVLERLERAFVHGRAAELRAASSTLARVRVDLRDGHALQGAYGADQLQVLLARLFAAYETRAFAFQRDAVKVLDGTAFARATWVRSQRSERDQLSQTLTFTLARENGAWRLIEIRSSP